MPPKKRGRICVCGLQFATPRAYGVHVVACTTNHRHQARQRLLLCQTHTTSNNRIPSSNSIQGATHQQALSMNVTLKQQRTNIVTKIPAMQASVMAQRQQKHEDDYVTYLQRMNPGLQPSAAIGDGFGNSNANTTNRDNHDDDNVQTVFDTTDDDVDADISNDTVDGSCSLDTFAPIALRSHSTDNNIRFKGSVAPATAAGITLMNVLSKHTSDLSLYNDVVGFISNLADSGYDFKQRIPNRNILHSTCETSFNYSHLEPNMIEVPVATMSTPTVIVPVFDIEAVLSKMLCNPALMKQEHFAKNYNIFTGQEVTTQHGQGRVEYYDEFHTGQRWQPAVDHFCAGNNDLFPCALVIFYDKSHADRHGSLAVAPIMFTLTLFNKTARAKCEFWDILAYIPNLDYQSTKASKSATGTATSAQKCQDEHVCLHAALHQLKGVNDRGGMPLQVMGKNVHVKVWIHVIVGDIVGNNSLLGSYKSANVQCPYRDCGCAKEDFVDPDAECVFIRKSDLDQMKQDNDVAALKAVSKHNIRNAFDDIPMSDPLNTIYWSTPPETMHAIASGIIPYMLESIGSNIKQSLKDGLNNLHLLLHRDHAWQSERGLPRTSARNPICETTKTQATEMTGNLFLLMCGLHTTMGVSICDEAGISLHSRKGKIETIKMILALEKWFNRRNAKTDVDDSSKINSFVRRQLIPNLQKYFPRTEGQHWMIPKVHSLTKFATFIQAFGSAINFYGGFGESHLKVFMKHLAHLTQQRPDKFATQLATNHYRQQLFEHSLQCIQDQTKMNYAPVHHQGEEARFKGKHDIQFQRVTNGGVRFDTTVHWHWNNASNKKDVDTTFLYAIGNYMATYRNHTHFRVTGYTHATLPNAKETLDTYDSNPSTHSMYTIDTRTGRNEWCMILTHKLGGEKEDEYDDVWNYLCPARIHGFFRFDSPGLPTPILLQQDDAESIHTKELMDKTMYVVVRTHTQFLGWDTLEKSFIHPIQLGDLDKCTYIFPVSRIVNPLYVFKDHGKPPNLEEVSFFASLPARYWAFYIDYMINPNSSNTGPRGFSQKGEEYTD